MSGLGIAETILLPISSSLSVRKVEIYFSPQQLSVRTLIASGGVEMLGVAGDVAIRRNGGARQRRYWDKESFGTFFQLPRLKEAYSETASAVSWPGDDFQLKSFPYPRPEIFLG